MSDDPAHQSSRGARVTFPKSVDLLYAPSNAANPADAGILAAAEVVVLTDALVTSAMGDAWWLDERIDAVPAETEIDRHWEWHGGTTDIDGRDYELQRLAITTGDGAVQGVAFVTVECVAMQEADERGRTALFVERLFAAPRNRPALLRSPEQPIYFGAGRQLLGVAVELSRAGGCDGRLKLDASPGAVDWYRRRGLRPVRGGRTLFESVEYTGMELSVAAADRLVPPAV